MAFDHSKLDVYRHSLQVPGRCDEILTHLPRGQANARTQIDKASTSVVANIAEGAGEFSPAEKARFYRIARRSAIELAAWLDIVEQRQHAPKNLTDDALTRLEQVVSMLLRLIQSCDRRGE